MQKNARYSRCRACTAPIRCSASHAPTQRAAKPRAIFPATQCNRAMPVLQPVPNSPLRRTRAGTSPRHALPAPAPVLLQGERCPGSLHARVPAGLPAPACFPSEKPDENQHAPTEHCDFFKIGTFQPSCRKAACQLEAPCPCQRLLRAKSWSCAADGSEAAAGAAYFSHPRSGSQQIISEIPSPLHAHFLIVLTASAGSLAGTAREGKAPKRALATAVPLACCGCAICAADAPCLSSRPEGSEAGCCRWHQEALAKTGPDDREGSTSDRAASLP